MRTRLSTSTHERAWDPRSRMGLLVVCIAIAGGLGVVYPAFLSMSNMLTTLLSVSSLLIASLGMMALLLTGNVDLSIGGQYALVGVGVGLVARTTQNASVAIISGLVFGFVLGYLNGRLVRLLRISPLIVTLGMGTLLTGLAFAVSGGVSVYEFPDAFVNVGQSRYWSVPLPVIISVLLFAVGSVIILRTVLGLRLYAIGGNAVAARLSGIQVDKYVTGLYAANGVLIGLVATLSVSQVGSASPNVGGSFSLAVLTAVILGGVAFTGGGGHPVGVFIGVLTIGVLNAGVVFASLAGYWQLVVQGAALLIALAADQFSAYRRRRAAERAREAGTAASPDVTDPDASHPGVAATYQALPGDGRVVMSCEGLTKYYGAAVAVRGVSLEVSAGEILCLAGDNGAGKSTLIKMLSGAIQPDGGRIVVGGEEVAFRHPGDARSLGVATVFQDLALCPNLGASENVTLGDEPRSTNWGLLSWRNDRRAVEIARERLSHLAVSLKDYRRPVSLLSGGQQQSVAIARVTDPGVRVVILDEPTAALGYRQTKRTTELIKALAASGVGVIVISHDVDTITELADRLVVLRQGAVILEGAGREISEEALIHAMAGYVAPGTAADLTGA
jgi:ribose/xylose/arabinose/galactoside ABC-type transport system permease subunit/ABC-type branched-subunit amino acid transport system ATPase component